MSGRPYNPADAAAALAAANDWLVSTDPDAGRAGAGSSRGAPARAIAPAARVGTVAAVSDEEHADIADSLAAQGLGGIDPMHFASNPHLMSSLAFLDETSSDRLAATIAAKSGLAGASAAGVESVLGLPGLLRSLPTLPAAIKDVPIDVHYKMFDVVTKASSDEEAAALVRAAKAAGASANMSAAIDKRLMPYYTEMYDSLQANVEKIAETIESVKNIGTDLRKMSSPIHLAVDQGLPLFIHTLIEAGANPNMPRMKVSMEKYNASPFAGILPYEAALEFLKEVQLSLLQNRECSVVASSIVDFTETPMDIAARLVNTRIVKNLILAGGHFTEISAKLYAENLHIVLQQMIAEYQRGEIGAESFPDPFALLNYLAIYYTTPEERPAAHPHSDATVLEAIDSLLTLAEVRDGIATREDIQTIIVGNATLCEHYATALSAGASEVGLAGDVGHFDLAA